MDNDNKPKISLKDKCHALLVAMHVKKIDNMEKELDKEVNKSMGDYLKDLAIKVVGYTCSIGLLLYFLISAMI